jgi:F-type H+-transporting ATPase subunit gamma
MKIVASTKMTRAQKAMTDSRTYGKTSNKVFEEAETKPMEGKKTLLVVASSDKGLCGGIHSGLTRTTRRMLIEDPEMHIAIIGEKCKAQLGRSNAKNVVLSFAGIGRDIPTFADAQAIASITGAKRAALPACWRSASRSSSICRNIAAALTHYETPTTGVSRPEGKRSN